jgi:hypothetical protein
LAGRGNTENAELESSLERKRKSPEVMCVMHAVFAASDPAQRRRPGSSVFAAHPLLLAMVAWHTRTPSRLDQLHRDDKMQNLEALRRSNSITSPARIQPLEATKWISASEASSALHPLPWRLDGTCSHQTKATCLPTQDHLPNRLSMAPPSPR